jgi:hypothetical protein
MKYTPKMTTRLVCVVCLILSGFVINTCAQTGEKPRAHTGSLNAAMPGEALTIDEAMALLKIPGAAAPPATNLGVSPEFSDFFRPPYTSIEPVRLFDHFYFVGTTAVGAFIVDTGDGLVMLDTGCGDTDVAMMVADIKKNRTGSNKNKTDPPVA